MKKIIVRKHIEEILNDVPFAGDAHKRFKTFVSKELNERIILNDI